MEKKIDENKKANDGRGIVTAGEVEMPANGNLDLSSLRLSQDFSEIAGVKKIILTIPVRKPNSQEFIRVHSDDAMAMQTAALPLKEERETYLVSRELWSELPGLIIPVILYTTINRQNVLTLWPIRLPGEDGRHNQWHKSALEAANLAKREWIRLEVNTSLGGYEVCKAAGNLPEPEWPDLTFQRIVELAFKDHFIQDESHPVLRRFRGEL